MTVDLDALEALARAATPGPWRSESLGPERVLLRMNYFPHAIDARYIAATSPDVVLALIAELRTRTAMMESLVAEVRTLKAWVAELERQRGEEYAIGYEDARQARSGC